MRLSEILKNLIEDEKLSEILKREKIFDKKTKISDQLLKIANSLTNDYEFSESKFEKFDELPLEFEIGLENSSKDDEIIVYTDGAVSGNPGIGGIGCVIFDADNLELAAKNENIGIATNNVAEYKAILLAVDVLSELELENKKITFFADSELMVKQLQGKYKISNPDLQKLAMEFFRKSKKFKNYTITHIRREKNKIADNLAVLAKSNKIVNRRINR